MFQFLTQESVYSDMMKAHMTHTKQPQSPAKIPQSPNRKVSDTPKLRQNNLTDSALIRSTSLSTQSIPYLLQNKTVKVAKYGKVTIFKQIPQQIMKYQTNLLNSINQPVDLYQICHIKLQDKIDLRNEFTDYFYYVSDIDIKDQFTVIELFTQEILGLPYILAQKVADLLPTTVTLADMQQLYQQVSSLHPEERLYRLFGPDLNYYSLLDLVNTIIINHEEYAFVQPAIYVDSLVRATTTRIMFDADIDSQWRLNFSTFKRSGYSLLRIFFEIQNTSNISEIDSPFGYEQFYVLYCLYSRYAPGNSVEKPLQEIQLRSFNDFQFNGRFVKRAFRGCGRPLLSPGHFQFEDFIIMLLADVCFDCPQSCAYMFNIGDIDGDGVIDYSDFEQFWRENCLQLEQRGLSVAERDLLIQLQDMTHFSYKEDINFRVKDLIGCKMAMNLFDAMYSPSKWILFEGRDPFIGNSALQEGIDARLHFNSGVWKQFCIQMYNQIAGED